MNASRRQWALLLLTVYFLVATFNVGFSVVRPGLDASWIYALNYLTDSPLAYGRDVAFTYGPLGYVMVPLPFGAAPGTAAPFRLALQLLFGGVLGVYVARSRGWVPVCAFLVAQIISRLGGLGWSNFMDYQLLLICGLLLGLALMGEGRRPWAYPLAGLVAALSLFLKFGTGLGIGLTFGVAGLGLLAWRRGLWKWVCGSWLLAVVAVAGLAAALLGSVRYLPTWLRAGLEIAGGYSSAMSLVAPRRNLILAAAALAVYGGLTLWLLLSRRRLGLLALALSVAAFAAFKGGFVRQDEGHEPLFFVPLPVLVSVLVINAERARELAPALAALVLVFLLGCLARLGYGPISPSWKSELAGMLSLRMARESARYLTRPETFTPQQVRERLQGQRLPEEWLAEVDRRTQTADVLPWEISYCPANGLSWSPLPTLQLYTAFTPWLDGWNARHFIDTRVPDFVIVEHLALDGRHPLWDGPATWRAVLNNYEVRRSDAGLNRMLLRRKAQLVEPVLEAAGEGEAAAGQWVAVPDSASPLYLELELEPSLWGKIRRTLLRFPRVEVELVYESGREATYRVMPGLARGGLLMNYLPVGPEELEELFNCQAGDRVARFRVAGSGASLLTRPVKLTWKRAPAQCASVSAPDPAAAKPLPTMSARGTDPAKLGATPGETDFAIDALDGYTDPRPEMEMAISARRERRLVMTGWAVDRQAAEAAGDIFINVDGERDIPIAYGIDRQDVASHFGRPGYRRSGFRASIPLVHLGPGRHTLRLKIVTHDRQRYYQPEWPLTLTIRD